MRNVFNRIGQGVRNIAGRIRTPSPAAGPELPAPDLKGGGHGHGSA